VFHVLVVSIEVCALSHVGAVREANEDSLVVGPWTLCATVTDRPQRLEFDLHAPLVVAIADGLGGHAGGEVASSMVAQGLASLGPDIGAAEQVVAALRELDERVNSVAERSAVLRGMGTTVAGVVFSSEQALVFNVGDSRVYAEGPSWAHGGLRLLSIDDNPPLLPGQRSTPIVTQTIGGWNGALVEPHVHEEPLQNGAGFLICSDGLTDLVDDDTIERAFESGSDLTTAGVLWAAAMEAGGVDNISIAIARVVTG
jgi:serine/threonine protein phosphatase PrpC